MIRLASLAAALVLIPLAVPSAAAAQEPPDRSLPQVDCDSICLIAPDEAPPECACGILNGTSGSGGSVVQDTAAARVLEEMREVYLEQIAGIDDYTVVQVNSAGGPPVVLYYEKETVGDMPTFRLVPPSELAEREAEATGMPTPAQTAEGMATMFDMLAGMAVSAGGEASGGQGGEGGQDAGAGGSAGPSGAAETGPDDGPGDESDEMMALVGALVGELSATGASGNSDEGSASEGANAASGGQAGSGAPAGEGIPIPAGFWPAVEELAGHLTVAADELRTVANIADFEDEETDFVANVIQRFQQSEKTRLFGKDTLTVNGERYSCDVLVNARIIGADGTVESDPKVEFDGLEAPDGMSVQSAYLWVSDENSPHPKQPLKLTVDVGIADPNWYSPSPRTITRTASELGVANGWVYQKRTRFHGLETAIAGAIPYVETLVCRMLVNQAEPFGEKSEELVKEAMANCSK